MEEFDVQECFAVTRLGKARASGTPPGASASAVMPPARPTPDIPTLPDARVTTRAEVEGMTL